jgi:hypothetical protein
MKGFLVLFFVIVAVKQVYAQQSVGIGTTTPNSSAILEINSSSKGVLLPRLADTTAIASPVKGLVIYNNANNKLWYYDGGRWQPTVSPDSIWYKVNDSTANTTKKYIGINADPGLIESQATLQVNGSLLVYGKSGYSNTAPTAGQIYTMNNTGVTQTVSNTDSVFRIYDPGGTGNYSNTMQGNIRVNGISGVQGFKVSSVGADFGISNGDTLWISKELYPDCRTDYEFRVINTLVNPADFIISAVAVNFIFRSNADFNNSKGFNLLVKRLYNTAVAEPIYTAGTALVLNTSDGTLRAGLNNTAINGSTAIGNYVKAIGYRSVAIGNTSTASGGNAMAIGEIANASGNSSTALGFNTTASGIYATAMGHFTTASGDRSTAIGSGTLASGDNAVAMGSNTESRGYSGTVVGMYNNPVLFSAQSSVNASTPLFIVGNGDNNSSLSNALVVLKSGFIGIGSNIPSENLVLNDPVNATLQLQVNGSDKGFVQTSGNSLRLGVYSTNPTGNVIFRLNGADRFTIFPDGDATLTGTLTQNSDERFKDQVTPLRHALDKVLKITGYQYYWKPELRKAAGLQIGLIAQNVEAVLPELVATDKQGLKSVAYQNMVPVLIEAIKEQQKQMEVMQQQIDELKKINKQLYLNK